MLSVIANVHVVRDSRHFVSRDGGFYLKLALEVQPPRRNDD
jgi:hypothetical protein